MAQINSRANVVLPKTHEGSIASKTPVVEQLRRSILATFLWEDGFYESGEEIASRIQDLTKLLNKDLAATVLLEAKIDQKLRHAPLLMAVVMARLGWLDKRVLAEVITRPDDLTEFLSLYWKDGKCPLSHQVRKGLALAFQKFNEYQLAKYNRPKAIKLRDVMRLVRPVPNTLEQATLWGKLVKGELGTPDTWEVALSTGKDKKETFERLLAENKLGDLAFLRNLRNMVESGVDRTLIKESCNKRSWSRILPFQFLTAARYAPTLEQELEKAMLLSLQGMEKITGLVNILVDASGSMAAVLSSKSELTRFDAASGVAILAREICEDAQIYTFNERVKVIPARRGFALRDALGKPAGGTYMWRAIQEAGTRGRSKLTIVLTDEETSDNGNASYANTDLLVIVNVGQSQHGVGYGKGVLHISGWSENVVTYIQEYLKQNPIV